MSVLYANDITPKVEKVAGKQLVNEKVNDKNVSYTSNSHAIVVKTKDGLVGTKGPGK